MPAFAEKLSAGRRSVSAKKSGTSASIQTKQAPTAHTKSAQVSGGDIATMQEGGEPLNESALEFFEPRFGYDFSQIRIHADASAARSARGLNALAYASGHDIVFGAGQYAPTTSQGKLLLAHELAHVIQQTEGKVSPGVSPPHDANERSADEAAGRVMTGSKVGSSLPQTSSPQHGGTRRAIQRQYAQSSAPTTNPNSLIPIADFITYIEAVERSFPSDTPMEIVTRIRVEYYNGLAFETLIPDAQFRRNAPAYAQPPAGGGTPLTYPNNLSDMRFGGSSSTRSAYDHLTAHADENAIGDNPSPYIVMPDGSRIDVGHLLLGLDALLHPRVGDPYAAYGIPSIDPASWAADLALASYWMSYHLREGHPASDAAIKPGTADFDAYYRASAPNEDLLGDADSFGANQQWGASPGQTLSQVLRAYYLGAGGRAAGLDRRWRTFCSANGLGFTVANGTVTWSPTIEAAWEPRLNRLCDLFDSGTLSRIGSMTVGTSPSRGAWPYSLPALRRFLVWLKPRLESEISAHP